MHSGKYCASQHYGGHWWIQLLSEDFIIEFSNDLLLKQPPNKAFMV